MDYPFVFFGLPENEKTVMQLSDNQPNGLNIVKNTYLVKQFDYQWRIIRTSLLIK